MTSSIRRSTAARTAALLAVFVLALILALPSGDPAARARKKPPKLYWGAWIGKQLTGTEAPYDMSAVSKFQGIVGKPLSIVEFAVPWANCSKSPCYFYPFPTQQMQDIRNYGAIPILGWNSAAIGMHPVDQPDFQLSDVIAGKYDSYIASFASAARDWGHPFFLRFNWEMNGDWFSWSEGVNGNQPGESNAAWRHVHNIFTSVGATNASWVWCPLAEVNKNTRAGLRAIYPGDGYVDWTCLDGYNWGNAPANPHPWRSFNKIFRKDYRNITKRIARSKPMMIAEIGSHSGPGSKPRWLRKMFKLLKTDYRRIRAFVWFDVIDRTIDWPIETSPAVTKAFSRGVGAPRFLGNAFGNIAASPIPPPPRRR
jgi:mannan endo-1,4-beta-mannosidase